MTRMSSYEDIIMRVPDFDVTIATIDYLHKKRILKFVGHIERMEDDRIRKQVLYSRLCEGL